VTGHRRGNGKPDIDFESLAGTGGTLVFMMGISTLGLITKGLLDAGKSPDTPAAIIEKGTGSAQRVILSTLKELEQAAADNNAAAPSVIVVGEVAGLSSSLGWTGDLPLFGVRAVITRPKELASGLASMLRERGAEVVELPAIGIEPVGDNTEFHDAIRRLSEGYYSWIVFTSPSGVRIFFEELTGSCDSRALAGCRIAAIGRGSERELLKHGIRADMIPSSYDGRTLGCELRELLQAGDRVLIPRAAIGNPELTEELLKAEDVTIDDIATYDTVYRSFSWFDAGSAFEQAGTYAVFTSASTVRGFVNAYPGMNFRKVRAVCIGKQTAAEAKRCGMGVAVSEKATLESLCDKLEEVVRIIYR
jgi:uroporphyrinogen III methyltransferase/synthase